MLHLPTFRSVIRRALGIPAAITSGIRRGTINLVTGFLRRQGLDVGGIVRQAERIFRAPTTAGERMDITKLTERENLRKLTAAHNLVSGFPRNNMFETLVGRGRNYMYRMRLSIYDPKTRRTTEQWVSLFSDTNDSKETLYAQFIDEFLKGYGGAAVEVLDWNVEEVWHNKGSKY